MKKISGIEKSSKWSKKFTEAKKLVMFCLCYSWSNFARKSITFAWYKLALIRLPRDVHLPPKPPPPPQYWQRLWQKEVYCWDPVIYRLIQAGPPQQQWQQRQKQEIIGEILLFIVESKPALLLVHPPDFQHPPVAHLSKPPIDHSGAGDFNAE